MKRINIYIKEETDRELEYLSQILNKSKSELFRSAVHEYRNKYDEQLKEFMIGLEEDVHTNTEKHLYTSDEVRLIKKAENFDYFIEHVASIITLDGIQPFEPYDYQKQLAIDIDIRKYLVINQSRQIGVSVLLKLYLLHSIIYNDHHTAMWLSNTHTNGTQALSDIKKMYELLPDAFTRQFNIEQSNKRMFKLSNGSYILADSCNTTTIRGRTINTVIVDEFAFVKRDVANEFMKSCFPVAFSGQLTKVIITSTPYGFNHFYKICTDARSNDNRLFYVELPYFMVPDRDVEWCNRQIATLGMLTFLREYMCEFIPLDADESYLRKYEYLLEDKEHAI